MSDLYFIRVKDGPVKIGQAADVQRRLRGFQVGSPYELILVGVVKDAGMYESDIHTRLWEHRIRGEWFEWNRAVEKAVNAALDPEKWRKVLRLPDPEPERDWRIGSPLYPHLQG